VQKMITKGGRGSTAAENKEIFAPRMRKKSAFAPKGKEPQGIGHKIKEKKGSKVPAPCAGAASLQEQGSPAEGGGIFGQPW